MPGSLCLVLHAHLPFVRHPEHEQFLEETWLFEAVAESYLPLLQYLTAWEREGLPATLTFTLSPTLCAMLRDPLLQDRCEGYLRSRVELAEREVHRTVFAPGEHRVAAFYLERLSELYQLYRELDRDIVGAFARLQHAGRVEIITCSATHAILPLLRMHPESVRAQLLIARDHYRECFGRSPRGIWLPECAYTPELEPAMSAAGLRWFILDSHGLLNAHPKPHYGIFAPVLTPGGLAVFARDTLSARQVWSRDEGYPGDFAYRDFYRDIGFDLDYEYVRPYLASPERGFTGIKYHQITGKNVPKELYDRAAAVERARVHAEHFVSERVRQLGTLTSGFDREPVILSPYDAELFGHWWFEGPEFLDAVVRVASRQTAALTLASPEQFLARDPVLQVATPAPSSWGEAGHWRVWLNEENEWIWRRLHPAQKRLTELVRRVGNPSALQDRALRQLGRELLLAQSSDWPFIVRTGTSPEYARRRVEEHLERFGVLADALEQNTLDPQALAEFEWRDNLFPNLDYRYFR